MNTRRNFLKSVGVVGTAAIAGCSSEQDQEADTSTPIRRKPLSHKYKLELESAEIAPQENQKQGLAIHYYLIDKETGEKRTTSLNPNKFIFEDINVKIKFKEIFNTNSQIFKTETKTIRYNELNRDKHPMEYTLPEGEEVWKMSLRNSVALGKYNFDSVAEIELEAKFEKQKSYSNTIIADGGYWYAEDPISGELKHSASAVKSKDSKYYVPISITPYLSHPYKQNTGMSYPYLEWISFDTQLVEASRKSNKLYPLEWDEYYDEKLVEGYVSEPTPYLNLPLTDAVAKVFKNMVDQYKMYHPGLIAEVIQTYVSITEYAGDLVSIGEEKYIRHPAEFLVDDKGDCTDFTFFLSTLYAKMGFETVINQVYNSEGRIFHISPGVHIPKEYAPPWADSETTHLNYLPLAKGIDTKTSEQLYIECVSADPVGRLRSDASSAIAIEYIPPQTDDSEIYVTEAVGEKNYEYQEPTNMYWGQD